MIYPASFKYEIVKDDKINIILRCDAKSMVDINVWVAEFGKLNYLHWNVRSSIPNGQRIMCSKKFVCQHGGFQKRSASANQKGLSKNAECPASLKAVIKLDTVSTRKRDPFIKVFAVINFFYFDSGMGISESQRYHEQLLELKGDFTLEHFGNGGINTCYRTVCNWHDTWRSLNLEKPEIEQINVTEMNDTTNNTTIYNDTNVQELNLIEPMQSTSQESNEKSKFENVLNLLNLCNTTYGSSTTGIKKLEQRLKKVKSRGKWENFLHTAGNCLPLRNKDGATIKVQPTTVARRRVGITKGSKQLLAGKPPLAENATKKRKRNFNLNINSNQLNAKSHGSL
ncbi:hypothetical protein ACI65C_009365 [Semiaphis heraclei]